MKKFLFVLFFAFIVIASGVWQSQAADLGKGFTLDGFATVGKLWDVDCSETDVTRTLNISAKKGEIYLETEIGVRYSMVRPFIGYQYLGGVGQDEVFSKEALGVDIFPLGADKASIGIRVSYNWFKAPNILNRDFAYTGLLWKW